MIHVEEHELDITFPSTTVSFVVMQPFVRFSQPLREPYRWADTEAPAQHDAIRRTLQLAIQDDSVPHFLVFPEYSIPGLAGVAIIGEMVRSDRWPSNTVVIAGVDGLTPDEYQALTETNGARVHTGNTHDHVTVNQWVNCCITWTKEAGGVVQEWVQPKIRPSDPELRTGRSDMFQGSAVHLFKAKYNQDQHPCYFLSLICYDWIGSAGTQSVPQALLSGISGIWGANPAPLHWVFVLQHNSKPNDVNFLNSTYQFLTDVTQHTVVQRHHAAVINASTAVTPNPCRQGNGGFSSVVLHPNAPFDCSGCRPTVCMQPSGLRNSTALQRCLDVVFREMGACVHTFDVRVPTFVGVDVTDRTFPVHNACVHAVEETDDPRLPNGPVPSAVKWLNDELDQIQAVADTDLHHAAIQATVKVICEKNRATARGLTAAAAEHWIRLAEAMSADEWVAYLKTMLENVDMWSAGERDALEHILATAGILGVCHTLDIAGGQLHALIRAPDVILQLAAITGRTHQQCREHFARAARPCGADPVVLVTRNTGNTRPAKREMTKIYEIEGDPGLRIIDYSSLVQACIDSESINQLREALDDIFKPDDKRII